MSKAELLKALDDFFSDTNRSPEETAEGLEELISDAEMKLESLGLE